MASHLKTKVFSLHLTLELCPATTEVRTSADHGHRCVWFHRVWGQGWSWVLLFRASCHTSYCLAPHSTPFPEAPSHPECCVFSSYCNTGLWGRTESLRWKDSHLFHRLKAPAVFRGLDQLARLRFLPCRINRFMRITVPSVVHELSETFFGVHCNFLKHKTYF